MFNETEDVNAKAEKVLDCLSRYWQEVEGQGQQWTEPPRRSLLQRCSPFERMAVAGRCLDVSLSLTALYVDCLGIEDEESRCALMERGVLKYGVLQMVPYLSRFKITNPELLQRLLETCACKHPVETAQHLTAFGLRESERLIQVMKRCIIKEPRSYEQMRALIPDGAHSSLVALRNMILSIRGMRVVVMSHMWSPFYLHDSAVRAFLNTAEVNLPMYQTIAAYLGSEHSRFTGNLRLSDAQDKLIAQFFRLFASYHNIKVPLVRVVEELEQILINPQITAWLEQEKSFPQCKALLALFMSLFGEGQELKIFKERLSLIRDELKDGMTGVFKDSVEVLLTLHDWPQVSVLSKLHLLWGTGKAQTGGEVIERLRAIQLLIQNLTMSAFTQVLGVPSWETLPSFHDFIWGLVSRELQVPIGPEYNALKIGYEALCRSQRIHFALERYVFKLIREAEPAIALGGKKLLTTVLKGEVLQERYRIERDSHLQVLSEQFPSVWSAWQGYSGWRDIAESGKRIGVTDEWQDLLLIGTEVPTCLHVEAHIATAEGLLSVCLDGKIRVIVIKKKGDNKILARALLRLLLKTGPGQDVPALLIDRWYSNLSHEKGYGSEILSTALDCARVLGLGLYRAAGHDARAADETLYSLSSPFPEHQDALRAMAVTGQYQIRGRKVVVEDGEVS